MLLDYALYKTMIRFYNLGLLEQTLDSTTDKGSPKEFWYENTKKHDENFKNNESTIGYFLGIESIYEEKCHYM